MNSNLGNKEIFASNLKRIMDERQKKPADICKDLKIPPATFSDWYHGRVYPRIDKIEMIANYLTVSKSDLVEQYNNKVDLDLRRIERARNEMPDEERKKMMDLLEIAFEKYFI